MSIYWNHFTIVINNQSNTDLSWSGVDPLNGTIQIGIDAPKKQTTTACKVQSWSDSTSGAYGTARWSTRDNVTLKVQFSAPNTGDPSGVPALEGVNKINYTYSSVMSACSGDGCPINSGNREWTLTVTFSNAS